MKTIDPAIILDRLSRLIKLQGSDPAFFVLSVHSFVESYLRDVYADHRKTVYLGDLMYRYREDLRKKTGGPIPSHRVLDDFIHFQDITNSVRHAFIPLLPDEAVAAADRLVRFCQLADISGGDEIEKLKSSTQLWNQRTSRYEDVKKLSALGYELVQARKNESTLELELKQYRTLKAEREALYSQRIRLEAELTTEREARHQKDNKLNGMRRKLSELEQDIQIKETQLYDLERARDYAINLTRLTLYNRTRLDYERELVRLTPDQQRILDEITLGDDFLIKGGAGTGKTLVLLEALGKLFQQSEGQLELGLPKATYVLITYSDTLVKYDRYVASIVNIAERDERILSADEYLNGKMCLAFPDIDIDNQCLLEFIQDDLKDLESAVLTPSDAAIELEDFLFANDVSEKEYCIDMIDRSGMRRRLDPKERLWVWKLRKAVVARMESSNRFTKNYSRCRLAEKASSDNSLRTEDLIFIDEVQDLAPCDLLALKALSRKAIIMAGDNEQAIFRKGFSFRRVGIDIVGRSRTINLNFRNTLSINELSEKFRERSQVGDRKISGDAKRASERPSQAFRPGPPPELYKGFSVVEMESLVVEKVKTYIDLLGYEPETISVLVPTAESLSQVETVLREAGCTISRIDDPGFSFNTSKGVRLSLMKSAKGLDFPATVVYLPCLPETVAAYDLGFNEAMIRNTIYVCMTRAMEQLSVVIPATSDSKIIQDIAAAFESEEVL